MDLLFYRLLCRLNRYYNTGDVKFLRRAHRSARAMLRLKMVKTSDHLRTVAQAINLYARETGSYVRQGTCGIAKVCEANKIIESLGDSGKVSQKLAEQAIVPIKCSKFECSCHPDHLVQTTTNDQVEVGSYNSPRFMSDAD